MLSDFPELLHNDFPFHPRNRDTSDSAALATEGRQFTCVGDFKKKKEVGSFKGEGIKEEAGLIGNTKSQLSQT